MTFNAQLILWHFFSAPIAKTCVVFIVIWQFLRRRPQIDESTEFDRDQNFRNLCPTRGFWGLRLKNVCLIMKLTIIFARGQDALEKWLQIYWLLNDLTETLALDILSPFIGVSPLSTFAYVWIVECQFISTNPNLWVQHLGSFRFWGLEFSWGIRWLVGGMWKCSIFDFEAETLKSLFFSSHDD